MKKAIIILIGILCFQFSNAQDTVRFSNKKAEINIGYFDLFSLNSINNMGVGFKFNCGKGAFRIGSSFYYNHRENVSTNSTDKETNTTIVPRVGYEFRQYYKRLVLFYGVDVCGSYDKDINNNTYTAGDYNNSLATTYGIGLSPLLGLKCFINKKISISTETSFNFMYSSGQTKYSSNYATGNNDKIHSLTARLSPLGIVSINFHF